MRIVVLLDTAVQWTVVALRYVGMPSDVVDCGASQNIGMFELAGYVAEQWLEQFGLKEVSDTDMAFPDGENARQAAVAHTTAMGPALVRGHRVCIQTQVYLSCRPADTARGHEADDTPVGIVEAELAVDQASNATSHVAEDVEAPASGVGTLGSAFPAVETGTPVVAVVPLVDFDARFFPLLLSAGVDLDEMIAYA